MISGPSEVLTYTCKGCIFFSAKYWRDYLDNDETDSGTETTCDCKLTPEGKPRLIAMYGSDNQRTPAWCPYLEDRKRIRGLRANYIVADEVCGFDNNEIV